MSKRAVMLKFSSEFVNKEKITVKLRSAHYSPRRLSLRKSDRHLNRFMGPRAEDKRA